jgi:hypothetical protein
MRPFAIGCGIVGLAAAWLAMALMDSGIPAAALASPVDHETSEGTDGRARAARIEVVRSEANARVGDAVPPLAIQSIGELAPKEVDRLRRSVSPESNTRALLKAQSVAEKTGRQADYATFLLELAATEKFRAASAMLERGAYLLLPRGAELPPLPDGYLLLQVPGFRREFPDEPCDVSFVIPRKEFPALDHAWSAYSRCQESVHDDESRRFNEMPLEARVAAIAAHDAARAEIDKAEDKLSSGLNAARRALIHGRFVIDRTTSTLWARPLAHR